MVTINTPRDPNTLSNYNNWRTRHTTANFAILFHEQRLRGSVVLQLESITDAESKEIILDSSHLDIAEVKMGGGKQSSSWDLLPRMEPYGSGLRIKLNEGVPRGESVEVWIDVSTTEKCTAIQWLTPGQTSNKKHPYMFSQCQAIHCRTCFPCQDTPDVKSTFDFNITSPLPVIASGLPAGSNAQGTPGTDHLYKFHQPIPIPTYLFALASGDIAQAPIGPRSTVATSPDELPTCKWELEADTERFLQAAESLVYPYAWGAYNVLVLPPSFPYGGMENPIYTFATPTLISGDRQNVDVIAHELSHSWSGNLVSNASWEHFWLNEGWTTYLERRIQAAVHGDDAWRDFSAIIGWKALSDAIEQFGASHEFTKLIVDLKGKDPDDAFSSIPYEKGFNFLYHIEKLIGKEKFDTFIPHYFSTWRGKSLDSYDFKATILDFFAARDDADASRKLTQDLDWDTWFYAPGYPPKPNFDTTLVDAAYSLADKWENLHHSSSTSSSSSSGKSDSNSTTFTPHSSDIANLSANQLVVFLERLLTTNPALTPHLTQLMNSLYSLSSSPNAELSTRFCQLALRATDRTVLHTVTTDLLAKVGRMKFVRPLYRALAGVDRGLAERTFERNRMFYHPICRGVVERDLGLD